jgi:hypothetical protein
MGEMLVKPGRRGPIIGKLAIAAVVITVAIVASAGAFAQVNPFAGMRLRRRWA